MNRGMANHAQAVHVVEFLVVVSSPVIISMLMLLCTNPHSPRLHVFPFTFHGFLHEAWKLLGRDLEETFEIARHSANGTLQTVPYVHAAFVICKIAKSHPCGLVPEFEHLCARAPSQR